MLFRSVGPVTGCAGFCAAKTELKTRRRAYELHTSLMIGDNWKNDVEGAKNVGMGNVYYNIKGEKSLPFKPGFDMRDWREIASFL